MSLNFFQIGCQDKTDQIEFGLCDDIPNHRAYIDHTEKHRWIAIVDNAKSHDVTFTAIDNCIDIRRADGTMESRCDGMITYADNLIFIELKERDVANRIWVKKGEDQLRNIIAIFELNHNTSNYTDKKAYLVNKLKPDFPVGQLSRMEKFEDETGYTFVIKQLITL